MKTKIAFLAALACVLTFATSASAESDNGFYEKDHVRGFISIGGDYRGMFSEFQKYVNQTADVYSLWHDGGPFSAHRLRKAGNEPR